MELIEQKPGSQEHGSVQSPHFRVSAANEVTQQEVVGLRMGADRDVGEMEL